VEDVAELCWLDFDQCHEENSYIQKGQVVALVFPPELDAHWSYPDS